VDISDATRPLEVGAYESQGWGISKVAVSNGLAMLALNTHYNYKTELIDVSNPTNVVLLEDAVEIDGFPADFVLADTLAYVAGWRDGVFIVDLSSPSAPAQIGKLAPPAVRAVTCRQGFAFAIGYYSDLLRVVAVPASGDPYDIASYRAGGDITDFQVAGEHGFLAVPDTGVIILDLSNPGSLSELATIVPSIQASRLATSETELFVMSGRSIEIFDVSDPEAAIALGRYDFEINVNFELGPIVAWEDHLYVGVLKLGGPSRNELWILDVSDPERPVPASVTELPSWNIRDIEIVGDTAFVALGWAGLMVFDVAHPETPWVLGEYERPSGSGYFERVGIHDGLALVATTQGSGPDRALVVLNVTNPGHPVERGGHFSDMDARSLSLMDGRACLLLDSSQLIILDVDNRSTCKRPRGAGGRRIPTTPGSKTRSGFQQRF
jgi:hypothetical protein